MTTAEQKNYARRLECEEDGLYYARYFFKQRTGGKMIVAPHHKAIQRTLDRVISGEINRLIINVPPGYTKTELATINMMGRGLALNSRARFMHLSYSHNLALLNSSTARGMIKSKAYQSMWPMELRDDADSKAMWWNEYGGGVYASSAAGQVTGFRAGHMEPGWQGALIIDDPVKPDDAYSETVRDGVNNRFNETIKSRLAIETTPMIVIMQRIHYQDLSGYLLRGGSGEMWHHLNLPVIIDNSQAYSALYPENTHAIPIEHGLSDGWLWPFKHNESHRVALFSHRRTAEAQYMQKPRRFNAEGALWNEAMIASARALQIAIEATRTVVAVDPRRLITKTVTKRVLSLPVPTAGVMTGCFLRMPIIRGNSRQTAGPRKPYGPIPNTAPRQSSSKLTRVATWRKIHCAMRVLQAALSACTPVKVSMPAPNRFQRSMSRAAWRIAEIFTRWKTS